jgi:hypothetical protein
VLVQHRADLLPTVDLAQPDLPARHEAEEQDWCRVFGGQRAVRLRFGEAKEREELVAAFSQARYDARTALVPCALEGRVGDAGGVGIRRVDDAMEVVTDVCQGVLFRARRVSGLGLADLPRLQPGSCSLERARPRRGVRHLR